MDPAHPSTAGGRRGGHTPQRSPRRCRGQEWGSSSPPGLPSRGLGGALGKTGAVPLGSKVPTPPRKLQHFLETEESALGSTELCAAVQRPGEKTEVSQPGTVAIQGCPGHCRMALTSTHHTPGQPSSRAVTNQKYLQILTDVLWGSGHGLYQPTPSSENGS